MLIRIKQRSDPTTNFYTRVVYINSDGLGRIMKPVNIPDRKMPISLLQHFRSVYYCPNFPEYPELKELLEKILDIDLQSGLTKEDILPLVEHAKAEVIASPDFRIRDTTTLLEMLDARYEALPGRRLSEFELDSALRNIQL